MRYALLTALVAIATPAHANDIDGKVVAQELSGILGWADINSQSKTRSEQRAMDYVREAGIPSAKRLARALARSTSPVKKEDGTTTRYDNGFWVLKAIKNLAAAELASRTKGGDGYLGINNSVAGGKGVVLGGSYRNQVHHDQTTTLKVSVKTSKTGKRFMVLTAPFARTPVVVPMSRPRARTR